MEVNPDGTSSDLSTEEAAELLNNLDETEENLEEVEAEEVEAEEVETEEAESEETEDEETDESEEELTFESLEELQEAAGLTQEQLESLKVKRKVDGVEEAVTLKEMIAGNQREVDYRNKTARLAEDRKSLEARREELESVEREKIEQVDTVLNYASSVIMNEYQSIDWQALKAQDPAQYSMLQIDFQQRQQQVNQAINFSNQEKARILAENQKQSDQAYEKYIKDEREALNLKNPDFADESKYQALRSELTPYLKDQGFSDEEIEATVDHRHLLLLRKCMAYDALENSQPKLKKVNKLPKVVRPGAKRVKKKPSKVAQLEKRAKQTGSIEDGAALLKLKFKEN